jgi:hypothetical protein
MECIVLVAILNGLFGIGERSCHGTSEDEVEWLCPGPFFLEVIDLKDTVGRNP